ncbi:serum amyloid A protein-like [Dreissena polymorpha]|uniref:Serum amyloid A protein n=1 Tax=Dreissena polymorpha TaxID=45954 RepID=A0A9D4M390_DREPO|nr:serum amyloid A protein-like [Dreissena polymorpha]XP_052265081.1 serum amyloid A protein-like [Dreissena polymorpha]XP_052265082.1 serum amyloid A protein-like [Dreissena polymorpha]XP_052265083.1 serum amyloid A protein-like [Dreissena polymorpha]KAH3868362.1 hypothetical protein DPMN_031506 [Dreissena polymorpha]
MKVAIFFACLMCLVAVIEVRGWEYAKDFAGGARDMWRAYQDMRQANTIGADKYFHARGNYDAASRGTGGRHAAAIISNARELFQGGSSGRGAADSRADQEANRWGRNGGDPNQYRPRGLNPRY